MNNKKKKVLFLTDDPRFNSGIGVISREFILNSCHVYDFIIVGGAMKHPEEGKIIDISEALRNDSGVKDVDAKIIPVSGYGTQDLIRQIITTERPDVLLHFTDPRYWVWLYEMEHEIRQIIPITYLTIWDCPPPPMYNKSYYKSCDLLMCISRQTYGLVHKVLKGENYKPWQITYVPHGLSDKHLFPITSDNSELYSKVLEKRKSFYGHDLDFILMLNSRNIRRKQIPDVILAFKYFIDTLPKDKSNKCALLLHTQPIDENGTDLIRVAKDLAPNTNIIFSAKQLDINGMNILYNCADVVINISNNEGWGLSITEARLAGKPVIVNMTGGLQDQVGIRKPNIYELVTEQDYLVENWHSNHDGKYKDYDGYATAIIPKSRSIQGSVVTPYIFDDRVSIQDVTNAILYWYNMPKGARQILGLEARSKAIEYGHTSKEMSNRMINSINTCLENFKPKPSYTFTKV